MSEFRLKAKSATPSGIGMNMMDEGRRMQIIATFDRSIVKVQRESSIRVTIPGQGSAESTLCPSRSSGEYTSLDYLTPWRRQCGLCPDAMQDMTTRITY